MTRSHSFPKSLRLLKRYQFQAFGRSRPHFVGKFLLIEVRPNKVACPRLGITVLKRFGKAHDRNCFKRLVRETFRLHRHQIHKNIDLLVKPLDSARTASLNDITNDFLEFLKFS